MYRFFVPGEFARDECIHLTGEKAHRIRDVLRLKCGERIGVFGPRRHEYVVSIVDITKDRVVCQIEERHAVRGEPAVRMYLYQALLKGEKFDQVLQKGTEVGISAFVPVFARRCIARRPGDTRFTRWQRIVEHAAEQAGRGMVPDIQAVEALPEAYRKAAGLSILPWEGEPDNRIGSVLRQHTSPDRINIFVGPEGGFDQAEVDEAVTCGIRPVTLGKRILRAETAGLVVAAIIGYEYGESDVFDESIGNLW